MEKTRSPLDTISEIEKTPLVKWLLEVITRLEERCTKLEEENKVIREENIALKEENKILKEEINSIKKLKNKPDIQPSTLNDPDKKKKSSQDLTNKRAGSEKSSKKTTLFQTKKLYSNQKTFRQILLLKNIVYLMCKISL